MLLRYCSETCVHQDGGVCTSIHCPPFLAVSEPGNAFCSRILETDPTLSLAAASQYMLFLLSFIFSLSQTRFSKERNLVDRNIWYVLATSQLLIVLGMKRPQAYLLTVFIQPWCHGIFISHALASFSCSLVVLIWFGVQSGSLFLELETHVTQGALIFH